MSRHDFAMAVSIKNKSKKKYAKGGQIPPSAKSEARPNPESKGQEEVSRNSGNKPPHMDSATSRPDIAQSQKPKKTQPLKHPRMVPIKGASLRLRNEEDHLESSAKVNNGPQHQPPKHDNEEGPDRKGPSVPALKMKKMAEGGNVSMEFGAGPEEDRVEHPAGLEEDNDQMDDKDAMSDHMQMLAEGGEVERDHEDSIAAAIMAKRDRMHAAIDSGALDMDHAVRMAEGGEINGEDSIYSDDSDMADLSRNAEEDANMEDQSSFDALRKENYSESEGLAQLDSPSDSNEHGHKIDSDRHDMVEGIRRKMAMKRQFKAR